MDCGDNCLHHLESDSECVRQQLVSENGDLELGGQAAMVEGRAEAEAGGVAGSGEALSFCDERLPSAALQALHLMQRSRRFCDVVLHVGGGGGAELHAHRAVLAAASPHLLELFSADEEASAMRPHQPPASAASAALRSYSLNGACDRAALEKLVDYAYTARLEVKAHQVAAVYRASSLLRMERVTRECARHLLRHLTVDNCLQTRALPGLAHDPLFAEQIDAFIAREFEAVSKSKILLSLVCVRVEVLNQTRQEMSLVVGDSICRLALDWMKRQFADDDNLQLDKLTEKTHLLYLAMDNSLQDCNEMPTGDLSDSEIVQDYKKLSQKNHTNAKNKRKTQLQPAKPRVLIYSRDIGPRIVQEKDDDWKLIAATKVGEHTFLALVVLNGYLSTLSVQLRCSQPLSPSPVSTPITTRPSSEEKPDLYCVMPNMSSVKCAVGCANLNNSLLVCGGYDRAECLRNVEAYNPQHNSWASLPPMREPRGRFDIAVVQGKVYAVGGSNGSTELSTVEVFDPEQQKWRSIEPLPLARCNTGVCDLDDKVYCIGGWNGQAGIKQCDVYDPSTNKWTSIAPLLTGRYQAGVCTMDGKLYAVGGCDAWNCLNSVEIYDPKENKWEFAKNMITARRGCGLAYFKGKLYAVGGSDGTHSLSSTEIYDPKDQTWTPGPSMTTPRANVAVAVIGSRLYAVGGFSGKTFLNSIEYLDESTDEWTTFVPKLSLATEADYVRQLEKGVAALAETLNSHSLVSSENAINVSCSAPS